MTFEDLTFYRIIYSVCLWSSDLFLAVARVNSAESIRYHFYGPNSSSVLRYLLESLPERGWYHLPYMVGYKDRLSQLTLDDYGDNNEIPSTLRTYDYWRAPGGNNSNDGQFW